MKVVSTFWGLLASFWTAVFASATVDRQVGILYEIWHCNAAASYAMLKEHGKEQLTTELVIQSNGKKTLDDVFPPSVPVTSRDIYNVQPELGFYCLCTPRSPNETWMPNCPMVSSVAKSHAQMLHEGGFDYIAVDFTNWPVVGPENTDIDVIRPLENLFEEWLALRAQGIPTPSIALWVQSPVASYPDGRETMWQYLLDHFYNNATRAELIWRKEDKEMTFFVVGAGKYNATVNALIKKNGGRNNIKTVKMWALFGKPDFDTDEWGFFSPCTIPAGGFTTSLIGTGTDCNQYSSVDSDGSIDEITSSGGYMLTQCALPFASPGHLRGLVQQKMFQNILEKSPPNVFMSSFNEHIGGRQQSVFHSNTAFNMGLPNDPQKSSVWVDTYGAEFSRDIEPTVEGGSRVWEVTVACIRLYKTKLTCKDEPSSPCCTTQDKLIWNNAFSLRNPESGDSLVTNSPLEKKQLIAGKVWKEVCHSVPGPSVFCVNASILDGRNGPFMLYNVPNATESTISTYRCITPKGMHFLSNDAYCENMGKMEFVLGYASVLRGLETLRELFRCPNGKDRFTHALDLQCDDAHGSVSLGFVR